MPTARFKAHRKFRVVHTRSRFWEPQDGRQSGYRLIFICAGEGHFILENQIFPYTRRGIIFLRPGQAPTFQEDDKTEIFVLEFDPALADEFRNKKVFNPDFSDTYKQAEKLCENLKLGQGQSLSHERDSNTIFYLIDQMIFEITQQPASHLKLVQGSIDLIVTMLARNNFECRKSENQIAQQDLTRHIFEYVRSELQQNKSIRIPELLFRFNISEEVANLCMMNQTGMSLRNFIFKYKTDLQKSRVLKLDIKELAPYLRAE